MSQALEYHICEHCGKRCSELDNFKSNTLEIDKLVCEDCFTELDEGENEFINAGAK